MSKYDRYQHIPLFTYSPIYLFTCNDLRVMLSDMFFHTEAQKPQMPRPKMNTTGVNHFHYLLIYLLCAETVNERISKCYRYQPFTYLLIYFFTLFVSFVSFVPSWFPFADDTGFYHIVILIRAVSSVGSERLVYTQKVGGSNPSLPTQQTEVFNKRQLIPKGGALQVCHPETHF